MNSLLTQSVRLVAMLTTALTILSGGLVAQDDLRPLVDSDAVQSVLQPNSQETQTEAAEDIPPPSPVPDAVAIPQPMPVTSADMAPPVVTGAEGKAYDFGVSYVSTPQGIQVQGVLVGSLASSAGLRPNDMIIAVNGNPPTASVLNQSVETVEVMRNGARQTLRVGATTTARPVMNSAVPATPSATYVPENRSAYSVPRTGYSAPPRPREVYSSPRTTYSAPRSYRYSPSYNDRYAPDYYRSSRPRVAVGYGVGPSIGYGRGIGYGYGRGIGYGPSIGPGFGPSFGRGYGGYGGGRGGVTIGRGGGFGRSGFSISIGF